MGQSRGSPKQRGAAQGDLLQPTLPLPAAAAWGLPEPEGCLPELRSSFIPAALPKIAHSNFRS